MYTTQTDKELARLTRGVCLGMVVIKVIRLTLDVYKTVLTLSTSVLSFLKGGFVSG